MEIFRESEKDIDEILPQVVQYIESESGLFNSVLRLPQLFDEPNCWAFVSVVNSKNFKNDGFAFVKKGYGFSFFNRNEALAKCLIEGIERFTNSIFRKGFIDHFSSAGKLESKAVPLSLFSGFSNSQLKLEKYKKFRLTASSSVNWSSVYEVFSGNKFFVPTQILYLSYPKGKELSIFSSISTGVAAGSTLSGAILRGLYEVIERDAFMIYYLNKLSGFAIDIKSLKNEKINHLVELMDRYKLEIHSIDIRTDNDVPVVISIVVDRTGKGKAISVGLKADINLVKAIIGSITEAFYSRSGIRLEYELGNKRRISKRDLIKDSSTKNRGLYWYKSDTIPRLDFWLDQKENPLRLDSTILEQRKDKELESILEKIRSQGNSIYWKDISLPELKSTGIKVVKVIVPEYQPLFLNENFPLLGGNRLRSVPLKLGYKSEKKLNTIPHPFL